LSRLDWSWGIAPVLAKASSASRWLCHALDGDAADAYLGVLEPPDGSVLMPYATNALDGTRVYFEDDGGGRAGVVLHGGFLDSIDEVRESRIAQALPADEFRLIYVDHRGLGRSDKPHDPDGYAMPVRVADAVAVLDELGVELTHFIGTSWGGRLCFGIGEHAPERVLSLVIGGQQPYAWPDSPITRVVTGGLVASRSEGMEGLVQALEGFWGVRFPDTRRARWLDNDPAALQAAWKAALAEGSISRNLRAWQIRCLIFIGAGDADFLDQARRAASEIPSAEFISLEGLDHYGAHTGQDDPVLDAILRTLRGNGS
jgi:pimeloyl-ACP methyl ester carboxylesterase